MWSQAGREAPAGAGKASSLDGGTVELECGVKLEVRLQPELAKLARFSKLEPHLHLHQLELAKLPTGR